MKNRSSSIKKKSPVKTQDPKKFPVKRLAEIKK